jgi:Zn-dependent protease with chaperone function
VLPIGSSIDFSPSAASTLFATESARLRSLAERIARANPNTFKNVLDIDKLCIGVDAQLKGLTARTLPSSFRIMFSPELYLLAQSDDQLAAVLSHELAHVTMQHQGFGETPPRMDSVPEFRQLKAEAKKIQEKIVELATTNAPSAQIFALSEEYGRLAAKMNTLIDAAYGEENAHLNWLEQEADEVGAELFLRAGFAKEGFIDILWSSVRASSEDIRACSALISAGLSDPFQPNRPKRGPKSHPSVCWRVYHLLVDEWAHTHAQDICGLGLQGKTECKSR